MRTCCSLLLCALAGVPLTAQARRIEGTVVDVLGRAIPRARITVSRGDDALVTTECDGSGRFVASNLPSASGFWVTARSEQHCGNREYVRHGRAGLDASLRIELLDAVPVEGRVVDATGAACRCAHVLVDAYWKLLDEGETHAVTDAQGRYRLANVPVGDVRLIVIASDHLVATASLQLRRPASHDFSLTSGESASYRISLEDVGTRDLSQLRVHCEHRFSANNSNWRLGEIWPHTLEGHTVLLSGVPADLDLHSIAISLDGDWTKTIDVPAGRGMHALTARVVKRGSDWVPTSIRGVVRDAEGKGVGSLRLGSSTATSESAVTEPDGTFTLATSARPDGRLWVRLIENDEYVIRNQGGGVRAPVYEGDAKAEQHVILVDRAARMSGVVLDSDGTPVFGAELRLVVNQYQHSSDVNSTPGTELAEARSDQTGAFTLERLDGHTGLDSWVTIECAAGRVHRGPFQIKAGEHVQLGQIKLPAPSAIEGIYKDETGTLQVGFPLVLVRTNEVELPIYRWSTYTNREGRFRFSGLPSGEYRVRKMEHPAARWNPAPDFARVVVKEGEEAFVERPGGGR